MKPLLEKTIENKQYSVFFDDDFVWDGDDPSIQNRFDNGDLFAFGVIESEECDSCHHFHELDSLWGIVASSADDALEQYLEEK